MAGKYGTLQVVSRLISEISELPNNPRTISDRQFEILVESIRDNPEFFQARPILLSNRTGKLIAFAGNKRLAASKEAGMKAVPTILFENLTEAKERELAIRDNIQNGDWDKELLIEYWNDLPLIDYGFDIELTVDPLEELPPAAEMNTPADYAVIVYFQSKDEQEQFFEKLQKEGHNCKI